MQYSIYRHNRKGNAYMGDNMEKKRPHKFTRQNNYIENDSDNIDDDDDENVDAK